MGLGVLGSRVDSAYVPPEGWTKEAVTAAEVTRLLSHALTCLAADQHPRRISEASREELARDHKLARKVANVYVNVLGSYGATVGDWQVLRERAMAPEYRRAGSLIHWTDWIGEQIIWLEQRVRHVATFAVRAGEMEWGNKMVFRLERELTLLKRVQERWL